MNDILKEEYLLMHYTNVYFPDKPDELATYLANIESISYFLRHFESLGYIADRIAF